ncbi:putative transglycosylase [Escherichia coli]|nr:putative transglycosylase [Escherichia coli]CTX91638.1 putative transglycosylase [Escherichia coli]
MKKWMLAICLMFINEICHATDCFDLAGRDYKIDPDLLRAISWKESRYRVNAIGINPVTGYGSGLMQVGVSLDIENYCTLRLLFNQSLVLDKVPEYGKPAKCCSP